MAGHGCRRSRLWLAAWGHGGFTLFSERPGLDRSPLAIFDPASLPRRWAQWNDGSCVRSLTMASGFALRAGPLERFHAPSLFELAGGEVRIAWPHRAPSGGGFVELEALTDLWGWVWRDREAMIFDASDWRRAHARVSDGLETWGFPRESSRAIAGGLEPIERVEIHVAGEKEAYRPVCYRAWVRGRMIGWPGKPLRPTPTDDGPLPMEAVMQIPRWDRTDLRTPQRPDRRILTAKR